MRPHVHLFSFKKRIGVLSDPFPCSDFQYYESSSRIRWRPFLKTKVKDSALKVEQE